MNRFRNIVLFIVSSFLLGAPPNWVDAPGDYAFIATITSGIIFNDGVQMGDEGDIFAAFDSNGLVRGIGNELNPPFGPYIGSPLFEMQVRSNEVNEVLTFKYYDASKDAIYTLVENYTFTNNDIVGNLESPKVFNTEYINLSFTNITSTGFDISYNSNSPFLGFQFDIDGVEVTGASGGIVSDSGYIVSNSSGTVLAFSLTGQSIPASSGTLISIEYIGLAEDLVLSLNTVVIPGINESILSNNSPISLNIEETTPELFEFNQSTLQAFYYFESVSIAGNLIDPSDWVAVFNDNICVGSRKWDTSLCSNGICDVPAMGDDGYDETLGYMNSGDTPTFKIYDISENKYYDANPSETLPFEINAFNYSSTLNVVPGCTDNESCNYDPNAGIDDGSCEYAQDIFDCNGDCLLVVDCNGVCGGNDIEDCAGVCGGFSEFDICGVCDDNFDNDCECETYDVCGICDGDGTSCLDACGVPNGNNECADACGIPGGDNSSCWYIDIKASINDQINDFNSRIGMHVAASDGFNIDDVEGYNCLDCYKDKIDVPMGQPMDNFDLYFPHPEWEGDIPEFYQTTNLEDDIRYYDEFSFSDFDVNSVIISDQTVYYPQHIWEIEVASDIQNIESNPNGEGNVFASNTVSMQFDFTNEFHQPEFTKAFIYLADDDGFIIEEITNGDTFTIEGYVSPVNVKIIIGWDSSAMPTASIVSPVSNQIFAIESDQFQVELDLEREYLIDSLEFFFEVNDVISNAIVVTDINNYLTFNKYDYYDFLDQNIIGDFDADITLHVEITDIAGVSVADHPFGAYHSSIEGLLFSYNTSSTDFETGWHLISPSLQANHDLESIFNQEAYDCSNGCSSTETINSGEGFYVRSYGENSDFIFNGEVLSSFSTFIDQGWNLVGNPLVRDIDLGDISIVHNGDGPFTWLEAANNGIISPTPIIYDNEIASHVGSDCRSSLG
jgi:hypothetical protein